MYRFEPGLSKYHRYIDNIIDTSISIFFYLNSDTFLACRYFEQLFDCVEICINKIINKIKQIKYEMDKVCRFCTLNCTTLENIFIKREQTDNEPLLILMLECCTNCEIRESDSLPQNICGPCISAAKIAFEFRLRCGQSEKHFKDIFNECIQLEVKYEIEEVCRFCTLNCTTLENIFAVRELTDKEPLLSVMLEYCTDCDIGESDSLPQNICGPCISTAKNAHS